MECVNIALGIIASACSIVAAICSISARAETKRLRDCFQENTLNARGNCNNQIVGTDNKVG